MRTTVATNFVILLGLWFTSLGSALAQNEMADTLQLLPFMIEVEKVHAGAPFKSIEIDSSALNDPSNSSLADVLVQESAVFVRSYGSGSLASPSLRGTGAAHTQIVWNGIPVNSILLGQSDLAVIPLALIDQATIRYGASSIQDATGGLGGSIHLGTAVNWKNHLNTFLQQRLGSFGEWRSSAGVRWGNSKWQSHTALLYNSVENDFEFTNVALEGRPRERQQNAAFRQWGFGQEIYRSLGGSNSLALKVNYFHSDRTLPKLLIAANNDERQEDDQLKVLAEWKQPMKEWILNVKSAYLFDRIYYEDNIAGLVSEAKTHASRNQVNLSWHPQYIWSAKARWFFDHDVAEQGGGLERGRSQTRLGALWQLDVRPNNALDISLILRQEIFRDSLIPWIPAAGVRYRLIQGKKWFLKGNYTYNFRAPTINDLYWTQWGNPNLKAERGHSGELGTSYIYRPYHGLFAFSTEATGFYSLVDNWILWVPDQTGSFRPENVRKVESKGVEYSLKLEHKLKSLTIYYSVNYAFTSSINKEVNLIADNSLGKQLIYVPEHTGNAKVRVEWKRYFFQYSQGYADSRFITRDNSSFLPDYHLAHLKFGGRLSLNNDHQLSLQFEVNNIWGREYQAIAWRAMPGRAFAATIRYMLNKN